MATLVQNTAHVSEALARLLEQFKGSENLRSLIAALVQPLQDLEGVSFEVYTEMWLSTAEGVQLDGIGEIVGQPRDGRTDVGYRPWIQARILVNRSNGKGDEILRVAELVVGSLDNVHEVEEPPAAYTIRLYAFSGDAMVIYDILHEAKPAGVQFRLEYSFELPGKLFTYGADDDSASSSDTGFGDVAGSTGGHYAGVIYAD